MSLCSRRFQWWRSIAVARKQASASVQRHAARVSSDVAEVANRPKKRPGRRERSSITTRWQTMLVESRTIPKLYSTERKKREGFQFRHCERSEAIHAATSREMDCFVAPAPRNDGRA